MLKCRFYLNIEAVDEDYRPVIWPIKYPYWCSGESENDFILIAYVDSIEDLMKQWPEAHDIDSEEVKKIEFSSRFPKPDWYQEKAQKKREKTLEEKQLIEKAVEWLKENEAKYWSSVYDTPQRLLEDFKKAMEE